MPALLSRHNLTRTNDVDEARSRIADVFCPHRLELTAPRARLDTVHNGYKRGALGLNYLRYGTEVHIVPGAMESFYLIQIPLVGGASVTVGNQQVRSNRAMASLASPTLFTDMVWSADCEQLLVYVSRSAVQDYVRDVFDEGFGRSVCFAPGLDLTSTAAQSWFRLVNWVRDDIDSGADLSGAPIIATQLESMLIGGLFDFQPNTVMHHRPRASAVSSRSVRLVRDAIEADPAYPWTSAELARIAYVSVRSLQESFARDLGTTPTRFLRTIRLRHAHRELSMSSTTETTVSEVAVSWGFAHFGRFSSLYRATFGESPSQTLARG